MFFYEEKKRLGQGLLEYSMILSVIVMIFVSMGPMLKRNTQSMIKLLADQVGSQQNAEQLRGDSEEDIQEQKKRKGYLEKSDTNTIIDSESMQIEEAGKQEYEYDEKMTIESKTRTNMGFVEN